MFESITKLTVKMFKNHDNQIDEFEQRKSRYMFESITKLTVKMFRYHDIRASSYCKLPKPFCSSRSIVNMQNDDNYCFFLCILAHLHELAKHRERV